MLKFLFGVVIGVYLVVLHAVIAMFMVVWAIEHPENESGKTLRRFLGEESK